MIDKLSDKIAAFLVTGDNKSGDDLEIYSYGISLMLSFGTSLAVIFIIALIFNSLIEAAIYAFVFSVVRSFTGGYHCNTYFRCNALYIAAFLLSLAAATALLYVSPLLVWVILSIALLPANIVIIKYSPVEHKNKPIDKEDKKPLKIKAAAASLVSTAAAVVLIIFGIKQAYIVPAVLTVVAVAMLVEIKRKDELK